MLRISFAPGLASVSVAVAAALLATGCLAPAQGGPLHQLTLFNGTEMPISAGVVYSIRGEAGTAEIGDATTDGLVHLCQMGDPTTKLAELKANPDVTWSAATAGPILPGASLKVAVSIPDHARSSLHFLAMYGKSKEACAKIRIDSAALARVDDGSAEELVGNDRVILAGAFTDPALPAGDPSAACGGAADAVTCLRELAGAKSTGHQIRAFSGYLPGMFGLLETRFGAEDAASLLIPAAGGVAYRFTRR